MKESLGSSELVREERKRQKEKEYNKGDGKMSDRENIMKQEMG